MLHFFVQNKWKKENVTFAVLKVTFEQKKVKFFRRCQIDRIDVTQLYYPISKQSQTILHEIISSKCKKKTAKISWKLSNGKTFPSWLSSFLWTAYHVKTIKYQNDRIVDAVILVHHSFSWNMPHFLEKWQEVRRTLKLEGKFKSRLNSNCNLTSLNSVWWETNCWIKF